MPINTDPAAFAVAIGVIMALNSSIGAYRVRVLNRVKKNIDDVFSLIHGLKDENSELRKEVAVLRTLLDERTGKKK